MSQPRSVDHRIRAIVKKIAREFQPEKIILFGSYAWGHPTSESDLDLFIVKSGLRKPKHLRTTDIDRLLDRAPMAWDALVYTPEEVEDRIARGDFFIRRIMNEGTVLYAA